MPAIIPPTSSAQKNMVICFAIRTICITFAGALGKGNGVRVPNCPAAVSSHVKDANNIVTDIVGKTFAV